ncbi:MAG: ABC transporter permease subunit [Acidilobaceae archaeon]
MRRLELLFTFSAIALIAYLLILFVAMSFYLDLDKLLDMTRERRFQMAAINSAVAAAWAAIISMAISIPIGYGMSRKIIPGGSLVSFLGLALLSIPPVGVGIMLVALFAGPFKPIDETFKVLYTLKAVVLAQFTVEIPIIIMFTKEIFDYVNPASEEMLMTMGASRIRAFLEATLPAATPGLLAVFIIAYMRALGEFGATVVVSGQIPEETETLPVLMFALLEKGLEYSVGVLAILVALGATSTIAYMVLKTRQAGER